MLKIAFFRYFVSFREQSVSLDIKFDLAKLKVKDKSYPQPIKQLCQTRLEE